MRWCDLIFCLYFLVFLRLTTFSAWEFNEGIIKRIKNSPLIPICSFSQPLHFCSGFFFTFTSLINVFSGTSTRAKLVKNITTQHQRADQNMSQLTNRMLVMMISQNLMEIRTFFFNDRTTFMRESIETPADCALVCKTITLYFYYMTDYIMDSLVSGSMGPVWGFLHNQHRPVLALKRQNKK